MPIGKELLNILVCPETKEPIAMASDDVLAQVNAAVEAGRATNRGGEAVTDRVEEGLVREDGRILYPIREGIPIMLIDESIDVSAL